jgi:hypothetical protein
MKSISSSKDVQAKVTRFSNDDQIVIRTVSPQLGKTEKKGIVVGVYDGFLRVKVTGVTIPISVRADDCYLLVP